LHYGSHRQYRPVAFPCKEGEKEVVYDDEHEKQKTYDNRNIIYSTRALPVRVGV